MRPYIICHMVSSVDGRIDCGMVEHISGDEYYSTLAGLGCTAELEGRVTMEHYCAAPEGFEPAPGDDVVGAPSVHIATRAARYTLAVDTRGRLRWPEAEVGGAPLVCIVSEQVTAGYLAMLRAQGISWICCGATAIDLPRAMERLRADFGVERLALLGGGRINGGFLAAGLVDELSLLLAPGIDGRLGQPALFDREGADDERPTPLSLLSAQPLENGVVWLRYRLEH